MKQVFLPVVFFCLLSGCGKHNDKPDNPGAQPGSIPPINVRIKSINNNTYSYDSLGRLSQAFYSNSVVARTDYTYTKTVVTGTDFDRQGKVHPGSVVYTIGPDGLATQEKYIFDPGAPALVLGFTFNADRQLVEQIAGDEGQAPTMRTVYYYRQFNLDSLKTYSLPDNKLVSYERFEYYTDKYNTIGFESNGVSFLGAGSANLLKKDIRVDYPTTTVTEYTYQFDDRNRTIQSHKVVDGASVSDLAYTYFN
jgi:hypothetical protein